MEGSCREQGGIVGIEDFVECNAQVRACVRDVIDRIANAAAPATPERNTETVRARQPRDLEDEADLLRSMMSKVEPRYFN